MATKRLLAIAARAMPSRKFISGFAFGAILAVGVTGWAAENSLTEMGYLIGWSVSSHGKDVCSTPFIWPATREIEC
jgi:hypothetical protein